MPNLYPDPALASGDYSAMGGFAKDGTALVASDAGIFDVIALEGPIEGDFFGFIAKAGQYQVSVHVADHEQGGAHARIRAGAFTDLGIAGDGWTFPITVTAGTNEQVSFVLRGSNNGRFRIVPDENGEAIRITT